MTREKDSHRTPRRRPPADAFDKWLAMVDALLIEPLIDLARLVWRIFRGDRR